MLVCKLLSFLFLFFQVKGLFCSILVLVPEKSAVSWFVEYVTENQRIKVEYISNWTALNFWKWRLNV